MKKRIIPAAILAATLALAGCSNDDLRDPNGIDQAGTPILLADLGVASGGSDGTPAARYAIDATSDNPWGGGDKVVLVALKKGVTTPSSAADHIANTYTYQTDGSWKQDTENLGTSIEVNNGIFTTGLIAVETVSMIRDIHSYGGKTTDVEDYGNGIGAPLSKDTYAQSDHLSYTFSGRFAVSKDNYTISGITLEHQRADFVVTVTDGNGVKQHQLTSNASLAINVTLQGNVAKTYYAYNAGKTDGKTTFRVILPAGCAIQSATLYPEDNTDAGSKQKTITFGNAPASLESGKRYTASVIYYDYKKLDASITLGNWTAGNGDGEDLNTGNPTNP